VTPQDTSKLRTALVTGAASGIGRAIATALVEAGFGVALLDRDTEALATVAENLPAPNFTLAVDITAAETIDTLGTRLPGEFASLDVLVNAAGHDPGGTTRFDLGNADDWASAIETNLIGTMRLTRSLLPGMVARDRGDIVIIGSIAGIRLVPNMTAYNTSKAGLHAFSDHLRADLADTGIRIIEIMPGLTQTDLIRKRYGGGEARAAAYYARFGLALQPEDIARAVMFALEAPAHATIAQLVILPTNRA